jgi:malate dehydrogenase
MVEAILRDKKKILPCAAYLEGEYGIHNLFIGVPVKLGSDGIEEVMELTLNKEEEKSLQNSANAVQGLVEDLKRLKG